MAVEKLLWQLENCRGNWKIVVAIGKLSLLLLHIQDDAVINQKGRAISSLPGKEALLVLQVWKNVRNGTKNNARKIKFPT